MKLSNREWKLLILAVVIIGGFFALKWLVLPGVASYQHLQAQLQTAQHNWERKQMLLDRAEDYKQQLAEKKGKLNAVQQLIFIGNLNQARLQGLNILEQMINKSGLQVRNKNIRVRKLQDQSYRLISYNLTLDGRYKKLINFLQRVKQGKKDFIVNKLRINKIEIGRNEKLRINILLTIVNQKGGASTD